MARRVPVSPREPSKLRSGMSGNGGRFAPVNGHPDIATRRSSHHDRPQAAYRVANRDGAGLERHRGHKFSQADYTRTSAIIPRG